MSAMEDSAKSVEPVRFELPAPSEWRISGFAMIALSLVLALVLAANLGFDRIGWLIDTTSHPWVLIFPILPLITLFVLSFGPVFPPHSFHARFELARDHVRFVPSFVARSVAVGERPQEIAIAPGTAEVLLSHRFVQGQLDGYRIIVRAANGTERWVGTHSAYTRIVLKARDVARLTGELASATGLPTRAVIQRPSAGGTVEEVPWEPTPAQHQLRTVLGLLAAALPFAGGTAMGWLSPAPAIVVVVGLALWLCFVGGLYALARANHKNFPVLHALTTLVTFSATYAVCYVATAYLAHPH